MRKNNKKNRKNKNNRLYIAIILLCLFAVNFISYKTAEASTIGVPTNFLTLNTGLVGWWTFDGKDTNWTTGQTSDKSGNSNTGQMVNMSTTSSTTFGKTGQALLFDGSNDYVNGGNSSSMNISGPFTVSAWIYESATNSQGVITKHTSSTATGTGFYVLAFGGNSLSLRLFDGSGNVQAVAINSISRNKWYFFTAYYDGSYINACLNGTCTTPVAITGFTPASSQNLTIGAYSYTKTINYNGKIDDVRIYNRALSATEIKQLYNATSGSRQDVSKVGSDSLKQGLVGWWTFDGKDTNWATGQVTDKSGNGNTGQMVNMSTSTSPVPGKVGQALRFDGIDDSLQGSFVKQTNGAISLWIKQTKRTSEKGDCYEVLLGNAIGADHPTLYLCNGIISYTFGIGNSVKASTLNLNQWYHVVVNIENENATIYINGVNASTSAQSNWIIASCFRIGATCNGVSVSNFFNGLVDDVRIYNRALSASEIQQLYNMSR